MNRKELAMDKRIFVVSALATICLFFFSNPGLSHANLLLEGRLLKQGREISSDHQNVNLTLRVYDDEFSGRRLYEEVQAVVGDGKKLSLNFEEGQVKFRKNESTIPTNRMWLEVSCDGQVMNPRINLADEDTGHKLQSPAWRMVETGLRSAADAVLTISSHSISLFDKVSAPLKVSGAMESGAVIEASNSADNGFGVFGESTGTNDGIGLYGKATSYFGVGVLGLADNTSDLLPIGVKGVSHGVFGMGIYGIVDGHSAYAVFGMAESTGDYKNFGGYFVSYGDRGQGVHGHNSGNEGYGVYGSNSGDEGTGVYGSNTSEGNKIHYGGYFTATGSHAQGAHGIADGKYGRGLYGQSAGEKGIGVYGYATGSSGIGFYGNGVAYDFYAGNTGTYGTFTGAHDVRLASGESGLIRPGMLVSLTGKVAKRPSRNHRPKLSSTLPTVTLTRKALDKAVFGVLTSKGPLTPEHWYDAKDNEQFGVVNALGEGCMWVCESNGDIEAGDYLTSSDLPGYGQKQDNDSTHNYTVGRATESVNWDEVDETVESNGEFIKVYVVAVIYTGG